MRWPVESRQITLRFHDPKYIFLRSFEHDAIDIATPQGTPVYAAKDGVVAISHSDGSTAYAYVVLMHKRKLSTVYGELNQIVVSKDQQVKRGDLIGYSGGLPGTVGAGSYSTGPHLHFSVRLNGIPVDPLDYLKKK